MRQDHPKQDQPPQLAPRLVLTFRGGRWFLMTYEYPAGFPLATREESDQYQLAVMEMQAFNLPNLTLELSP